MFAYLVMGLLGAAKPARAQALNGPVAEVDRLAVRVVTDSYQLAIAPTMKVGEVEVQRFGMPPAFHPFSHEHFAAEATGAAVTLGLNVKGRTGQRGQVVSTGIHAYLNLAAYAIVQFDRQAKPEAT